MDTTSSGAPNPRPMLINGEWIHTSSDNVLQLVNPANGRTEQTVCTPSESHVDSAVSTGADAAKAWGNLLPNHRASVLHEIGRRMLQESELFAKLQMRDNGKVWNEFLAQVESAAATFRYYAAVCETLTSDVTPSRGNYLSVTVHEPYGVVAAITPWNSPLTMEAQKVAPALAAGNAVILKPSELTPSAALELGRLALDVGLPAGLLNVLPGGASVGAALVQHRHVKMVSFTGGTATGKRIAAMAAAKLMPVALELGGKSPHIVFADADIDAAVKEVAVGIFQGSGQSCIAGSRLFVQRVVADRVLDGVVNAARAIRVDLPDATGAQMGPIASFAHRARIERMVDEARDSGAQIVFGGTRPQDSSLSAGAFFLPTVVAGVSNRAAIAQEEIFGPVVCVLPFDDEDDLVAQANDTVFGLAAGIWTSNFARAWKIARRLDAGTVWINTYKQLSVATPFGGFKESGLGREKGLSGMRLYQQTKGIYVGFTS